ncbi:MAG TPA: ABC transporter substrate-binding protein [Ktedonobacterales bacterium]
MRYHTVSRAFVLVASVLAALGACALPSANTQSRARPDSRQVFQPLAVGARYGDLGSLDPALIQFPSDYAIAQLIFPALVTLDERNQVAPWAADRWETSADGLTWTFHLHPGMSWSDGTPIDANTYAYSINRSLDPCTASSVGYYLSGTDVELIAGSVAFNGVTCPPGQAVSTESLIGKSILVPDPLTLTLSLSHPAAYFPTALSYPTAWAVPPWLVKRYGTSSLSSGLTWTEHLAGLGGNLFTVKLWDHAGHIQLVRNERLWGVKPRLREIDWTLYKDENVLWADFQRSRGDTDVPAPSAIAAARKMPGFQQTPDLKTYYLTPNWSMPPFDDLRVRQALFLALDRSALAREPPRCHAFAADHPPCPLRHARL